jgi:hypothetical protein
VRNWENETNGCGEDERLVEALRKVEGFANALCEFATPKATMAKAANKHRMALGFSMMSP